MRTAQRIGLDAAVFVGTLGCCSAMAHAQSDETTKQPHWDAAASIQHGQTFATLVPPGSNEASFTTVTLLSGYDAAYDSFAMRAHADTRIWGPVDFRAGMTYVPNGVSGSVQPHLGLRVRLLNQDRQGIDLAVGAFYRMERFTPDDGMFQGLITAAWHHERLGVFANLTYGQDGEGDDRESDVALGAVYQLRDDLHVGVEAHTRFDLGSNDPRRVMRNDSKLDAYVAPTFSYSFGPVALLAQVGASTTHRDQWRTGVLALGGLAGAY